MALIVQKTGQRQGNANTVFYQLGAAQYGAGGATVFHDTTAGSNSVPYVTGYSCTTGYDPVTGLGSVDANALVNNWPDFAIAASPAAVSVPQGSMGASAISTTVSGSFSSAIALSASGLPTGVTASFSPATINAPASGSSTMTLTTGASSPPGAYAVTVTGAGGGTTHTTTLTLTIPQPFIITASVNGTGGDIAPSIATVVSGGSATFTITPGTGYHAVSLTDNGADVTTSILNSAYTITNITTNHNLIAAFAVNTYDITTINNGNGSITPSSASVSYGASVTLTIAPDSGYTLSELIDNGAAAAAIENPPGTFTYAITNVSTDHTISATFSQVPVASVPAMGRWGIVAAACGLLGLAGIGRWQR